MSGTEHEWEEWIRKASDDERSIQAILKGEGAASTACFLAQQMAEKCLKGLLAFRRTNFGKVHDLLEIETRLLHSEPHVQTVHDDLRILNEYYIGTRYPGDWPEYTKSEAQQAFTAAQRVKTFVLAKIKPEV